MMTQTLSESSIDWLQTAIESKDDFHRLLASDRRLIVLDVLLSRRMPTDLQALAVAVAEQEANTGVKENATSEEVALTLHHNHLPRMADLGLISYDPASQRVESVNRHKRR